MTLGSRKLMTWLASCLHQTSPMALEPGFTSTPSSPTKRTSIPVNGLHVQICVVGRASTPPYGPVPSYDKGFSPG